MRLVLARYSRPVTRVRHAGGFSFLKTPVKINSEDGFPKVRLGVIRNPLPLLLQLLSSPSSRSRRFLLYAHAGLCPASPCTPGALSLHLLLSCAITLLLTKQPPHGGLFGVELRWGVRQRGEIQTLLAACLSVWANTSLMPRLETARYLQPHHFYAR